MNIQFTLLNCFWLMVPLLAWNLALGSHLTDARITSDRYSPKWLLVAENVTRVLVFGLPVLMALQWQAPWDQGGLAVYLVGTLIYFGSWLPLLWAPDSVWSNRTAGLLAPRLTPFLPFLGIAVNSHSWLYGALSAAFIILHTFHGLQNLFRTAPHQAFARQR